MKLGNSQANYLWEKGFCRIEIKIIKKFAPHSAVE
jgi:hypothetical protein